MSASRSWQAGVAVLALLCAGLPATPVSHAAAVTPDIALPSHIEVDSDQKIGAFLTPFFARVTVKNVTTSATPAPPPTATVAIHLPAGVLIAEAPRASPGWDLWLNYTLDAQGRWFVEFAPGAEAPNAELTATFRLLGIDPALCAAGAPLVSSYDVDVRALTTTHHDIAFICDRDAPLVTLAGGVPVAPTQTIPTIRVTVTDAAGAAGVTGRFLSAGAPVTAVVTQQGNEYHVTSPTLPEGTYDLEVTATDRAGNSAAGVVTGAQFTYDTTPPTIQLVSDDLRYWHTSDIIVTWACDDALAGVVAATVQATLTQESANGSLEGTCEDLAGHVASSGVTGLLLDKTPPDLSLDAAPDTSIWHHGSVTVSWTCTDELSGVAADLETGEPTETVEATIDWETSDGTAEVICYDAAENAAIASVSGLKVDQTAPTITPPDFDATTTYASAVTLTWTCADALSGVESETSEATLDEETTEGSLTGTCTDRSGLNATHTVSGIKINFPGPSIERETVIDLDAWHSSPVTIRWTCTDADAEVLVDSIERTLDADTGDGSLSATCENVDGLTATDEVSGIKLDQTAPEITAPEIDTSRWYAEDITLTWSCSDALSGAVASTVSETLSEDTSSGSLAGTCEDQAGNEATSAIDGLKLDQTAPTITPPLFDALAWYHEPVSLTWTCMDATSGVVATTSTSTLHDEGDAGTLTGTCEDVAGNLAQHEVTGVKLDRTPPTLTLLTSLLPWHGASVTLTWACEDPLSGARVPEVSAMLAEDTDEGVLTGTCLDVAGNSDSDEVAGIRIDTTPPAVLVNFAGVSVAGYHGPGAALQAAITGESAIASPASVTRCVEDVEGAPPVEIGATFSSGTRTITCVATDAADNTGSATATVMIDATAPVATLALFPDASETIPSYVNASDVTGVAALTARLASEDGHIDLVAADRGDGTWSLALPAATSPAAGDYDVEVRATDGVGNMGDWTRLVTFRLLAPISITVEPPPASVDEVWLQEAPTFTWTLTGGQAPTLRVRIDGGAWVAAAPFPALADGKHRVEFRVDDGAREFAVGDVDLWLDRQTPTVLDAPEPGTRVRTSFTLYVNDDGLSPARLAVSGPNGVQPDGVVNITGLPDGPAQFTLTASDDAGNSHSTELTLHVDTTPPTLTFTFAAKGTTFVSKVTLRVATDADVVACTLDGTPVDLPHLVDTIGDHQMDCVASDIAGNERSRTILFSIVRAPRATEPLPTNVPRTPVAGFDAPSDALAGRPAQLDASLSPDATYTWDFGDGTSGMGRTVDHTWASAGRYTVTLTVTSADGGIDVAQRDVVVGAPPETPTDDAAAPPAEEGTTETGSAAPEPAAPTLAVTKVDPPTGIVRSPARFTFEAPEDVVVYWRVVDITSWRASRIAEIAGDGPVTVEYYGLSAAGKEPTRSFQIELDGLAPVVAAPRASGGIGTMRVDVTITDAHAVSAVALVTNLRSSQTTRMPLSPTATGFAADIDGLEAGEYSVTIQATDEAGQVSEVTAPSPSLVLRDEGLESTAVKGAEKGTPGAGPGLLAAVMVALAVALRRRRSS